MIKHSNDRVWIMKKMIHHVKLHTIQVRYASFNLIVVNLFIY